MIYRPLDVDKNEVRLLMIQPADKNSADILRCDLEHYSLDEYTSDYRDFLSSLPQDKSWSQTFFAWKGVCLQKIGLPDEPILDDKKIPLINILFRYTWGDYSAVSYAWGEDTESKYILLNCEQFGVTDNLYAALLHHRNQGNFGRSVKLWVDAICINQNDISERNAQIKRMRSIYGRALSVTGWLGQEDDNSAIAIVILRTMLLALDDPDYLRKADGSFSTDFPTNYQELLYTFEPQEWRALYHFFERPYWKRLWILQEISASSSRTNFSCGPELIRHVDLYHAIIVLGLDSEKVLNIVSSALKESGHDINPSPTFARVQEIARLCRIMSPLHSFHHIIDLARTSEQSILHDKVYGIIGLLDHKITEHITPDYALTPAAVYTDFARAAIVGTRSLEILAHKERASQTQLSLPSWVPDLTTRPSQLFYLTWNSYQASGESVTFEQPFDSEGNLLCRGIIGDVVSGLGTADSETATVQNNSEVSPYKSIADVEFALWNNLMAGGDAESIKSKSTAQRRLLILPWQPDPELHELQKSKSYQEMHSYRLNNRTFKIYDRQLSDFFPELPLSAELKVENSIDSKIYAHHMQEAVTTMASNLKGRTLMVTKNGHLGLAPISALPGDVIAVLLGCRWPVILRPNDTFYNVVGVCYIHDIMQGEMMEGLNDGRFQLEDITLC